MISLTELAKMIRAVREAQKHYFKVRTTEALNESKRLERELDLAVKDVLEPRPATLFGD